MTLVQVSLAWVLGILLACYAGGGMTLWAGIAALGLAAIWALRWRGRSCLPGVLLLALALGACRYASTQTPLQPDDLAFYNDRGSVTVEGYLATDPDVRGSYTQLELAAEHLTVEGVEHAVHGRVVLNVGLYPAHTYGERLRVKGNLESPPVYEDFDYRDYLAARGVLSVLRRPQVSRLPGRGGSPILAWIYARRAALQRTIEAIMPNPEAGLLSGILLGLSHTLPDDLYDLFRATGLAHIIVISGYNMALIAQALLGLGLRVGHRWRALWLSLVGVLAYTVFVGPSAPVLRATIMVALALVAQRLGRKSHGLTSLAIATLLMSAAQPRILWSASFQLSFAATLGLLVVPAWLDRRAAQRSPDAKADRRSMSPVLELLLTTSVAQLATLPVLWVQFGEVSLVALPTNLLALPVQNAILPLGFLAAALGAVWLPAGRAAAWLVWPFLRYTVLVVQTLGRLSWASLPLPHVPPLLWVVLAGLGGLLWVARKSAGQGFWRRSWTRLGLGRILQNTALLSLALLWSSVLLWSAALALPDGRLHVHFLDVGQGDAILIRSPGGRVILVDGGPDPVVLTSRIGQALPFWQRHIDLVVATHLDADHISGLLPVLERYRVGRVLAPADVDTGPLAEAWAQSLTVWPAAVSVAAAGQEIALGEDLRLKVLHPPAGAIGTDEDGNALSTVIELRYGAFSALLTGDISAEQERALVRSGALAPITTLKAAHHGSGSSTCQELLEATLPRIAILSVGVDNRYGHPHPEVIQRLQDAGCEIWRTDQSGSIELITDGERLWVRPQKRSQAKP